MPGRPAGRRTPRPGSRAGPSGRVAESRGRTLGGYAALSCGVRGDLRHPPGRAGRLNANHEVGEPVHLAVGMELENLPAQIVRSEVRVVLAEQTHPVSYTH